MEDQYVVSVPSFVPPRAVGIVLTTPAKALAARLLVAPERDLPEMFSYAGVEVSADLDPVCRVLAEILVRPETERVTLTPEEEEDEAAEREDWQEAPAIEEVWFEVPYSDWCRLFVAGKMAAAGLTVPRAIMPVLFLGWPGLTNVLAGAAVDDQAGSRVLLGRVVQGAIEADAPAEHLLHVIQEEADRRRYLFETSDLCLPGRD